MSIPSPFAPPIPKICGNASPLMTCKYHPKRKMRQFQWKKMKGNILQKSYFTKFDITDDNIKIDFHGLENMFCKENKKKGKKNKKKKNKKCSKKLIEFLGYVDEEGKKQKSANIALKAMTHMVKRKFKDNEKKIRIKNKLENNRKAEAKIEIEEEKENNLSFLNNTSSKKKKKAVIHVAEILRDIILSMRVDVSFPKFL